MKKRKRTFRHLNQFDRDRIEALLQAGHRQKEIAKVLKVNAGTISREISKHKRKSGCYEADAAHHKAQVARLASKYQGMKIEKHPELRQEIIKGLSACRSPDEIAGRMKQDKQTIRIGKNAVYRWLYSSYGQAYCRFLCTRRHRKRKQKKLSKREMIADAVPLDYRPKEGIHAEGDLFVSARKSETTRSGAIMVVPATGLMIGTMINNRKPVTMTRAVRKIQKKILVTDITLDRGIENRNHRDFGLPVYFCNPHSPWQKPHVEQAIGLLRRWFIKKKTDLRTVSEENLQYYLHILNNKWRKSLEYRSAYEVAMEYGIIQTKNPLCGAKRKVAFGAGI